MSQHRVGPSSITVESLLGHGVQGRGAVVTRPTRHRAEAAQAERLRAAAGAAVAGVALVGVAAQVAPALAAASPLAPERHTDVADEALTFQGTGEMPVVEAAQAVAAPVAEPVAPVTEVVEVAEQVAQQFSQPFGIPNLPAELAAPLAQVEQAIEGVQQQFAAPVAVRPVGGAISSGYGSRWGTFHYGLDFADQIGAPIKSVSDGTVIEAGPASGFGLWVRVLQDDGTTAVYGHVNDMYVQEGQRVKAGDVIASVGNRGQSTGPHLHLEIWDQNGSKIDPHPYLAAKGVPMHWGPSHDH